MIRVIESVLKTIIKYFSDLCLSTFSFVIIALILYLVPEQHTELRVYSMCAALALFGIDQLIIRTIRHMRDEATIIPTTQMIENLTKSHR